MNNTIEVRNKTHLEFLENGTITVAVKDDSAGKPSALGTLEELLFLILGSWDVAGDDLDLALAAGEVASAGALAWDHASASEDLEEVLVIVEGEGLLVTALGDAGDGTEAGEGCNRERHQRSEVSSVSHKIQCALITWCVFKRM